MEIDPDDWRTWPVPHEFVNSRDSQGMLKRLTPDGYLWLDGFEAGWKACEEAASKT